MYSENVPLHFVTSGRNWHYREQREMYTIHEINKMESIFTLPLENRRLNLTCVKANKMNECL